ncbi:ATP-binding cassette domain-containing protein [Ureibacillus terrenus]|uniref:ATP-binding cassette domain-containing protein n=1 Tax=Ureibacillus terrenus TaxID=118246 RepID=UPI002E1D9A60|nr:ATP-binding cassette domain-containing protein [Ureibacillus terrenus]
MKHPLLEVENLSVSYQMENKRVQVVRDLSFSIDRGETLAIVGESGSGKTATALSIIGLLPDNGKIDKGKIYFDGKQLAGQTEKEWVEIRGKKIAMIMQDPMSALNPVLTIGRQMEEVFLLRRKEKVNKKKDSSGVLVSIGPCRRDRTGA